MKVFVFCVAILLATAVKASPVDVDESETEIVSSEVVAEPESDAVIVDNDEPFSQKVVVQEEPTEVEEVVEDKAIDEVINESEGEVAIPFQQESGVEPVHDEKALEEEDETEEIITQEKWERIAGIEIPLCAQHTDERHPLHLSHLTDCTKFYKCSKGRAYLMDCPSEEHWSVKLDRCDYAHLAKCAPDGTFQFKVKKAKPFKASAQEEDPDQPDLGEFEIDPRCEGSDPFKPLQLRHPTDCTKFYKCYMGKAYVIKCPKGQQWAQSLNRCEHPQVARCSIVRPAIKPAQAIVELDEDDEDDDDDEPTIVDDPDYEIEDPRCEPDEQDIYHPIHFSHPTDCTMFYRCYVHKAYKSQCPGGLHFNEKHQYCDYPHYANCKAAASIQPASANAPEIPNCPQVDQEVNFAIEGFNNRYFSCIKGLAYLKECNGEELFNPLSKKCEKFSRPQYQPPQYQYPGTNQYPQYPGMPPMAGLIPNFPSSWDQFFEMMNQQPGMMNQFPGMNQYPGIMPQFPMIPVNPQTPRAPAPQTPNQDVPQMPINRPQQMPQIPNNRPQMVPQSPEFPSWMPVPNPNVQIPEFPSLVENPSQDNTNQFNYENGKVNSRCPSADDPSKPEHLSHETDCNKFYKCYNGRAFLLDCPGTQEWSDELQRCDYHQFAKCDPVELIKKKIQN